MKKSICFSIGFVLLVSSLLAWQAETNQAELVLTPDNAIEILFTHVKDVNYQPLLPYTTGPEEKRVSLLIKSLREDRQVESLVRRQAFELAGFRVHQQEIHSNVAAISFTWNYNRPPARGSQQLAASTLREEGCEALLVKLEEGWKIASVRPWVPEDERGYTPIQRQKGN